MVDACFAGCEESRALDVAATAAAIGLPIDLRLEEGAWMRLMAAGGAAAMVAAIQAFAVAASSAPRSYDLVFEVNCGTLVVGLQAVVDEEYDGRLCVVLRCLHH